MKKAPPDLSRAVIDATGAELLDPASAPLFTPEQELDLTKCARALDEAFEDLDRRERQMAPHAVKAGWWLMRAREIHLVAATASRAEADGRFVAQEGAGFLRWLRERKGNRSQRSVYNYIQAAANLGLTHASHLTTVDAVVDGVASEGRTLADLCRKPTDNAPLTLPDVETDPEAEATLEAEREAKWWRDTASEIEHRGLEKKSWATARLSPKERQALAEVFSEFARELRGAVKSGVPALPEA